MSTDKRRLPHTLPAESEIEVRYVKDVAEKMKCFNLCRDQLLTERHGLLGTLYLPEEYRRVSGHEYLAFYEQGELVGVMRIIPHVDLNVHKETLLPTMAAYQNNEKFLCDLGFYSTKNNPIARWRLMVLGLKMSVTHIRTRGFNAVYIQVPLKQGTIYKKLGFEIAGKPFHPKGWAFPYLPLILELP